VLELLLPHRVAHDLLEVGVRGARAQRLAQVVSPRENRQVRSLPSAVRRIRSQSPQNGSDTGLMKPIFPLPSAKRHTRAVALGSRGTSSSGQTAWMAARISSPDRTCSGAHVRSASSGMYSMKRTS
jgi:hypothetical protein